jgi:hypothetical protein
MAQGGSRTEHLRRTVSANATAGPTPTADQPMNLILFCWVEQQLSRISYKPGWIFTARPAISFAADVVFVKITMLAKDTHNPDSEVTIGGSFPYRHAYYNKSRFHAPSEMDDEATHFTYWLAERIQELEIHESREWLRYDGEIFDNPHAAEGML